MCREAFLSWGLLWIGLEFEMELFWSWSLGQIFLWLRFYISIFWMKGSGIDLLLIYSRGNGYDLHVLIFLNVLVLRNQILSPNTLEILLSITCGRA